MNAYPDLFYTHPGNICFIPMIFVEIVVAGPFVFRSVLYAKAVDIAAMQNTDIDSLRGDLTEQIHEYFLPTPGLRGRSIVMSPYNVLHLWRSCTDLLSFVCSFFIRDCFRCIFLLSFLLLYLGLTLVIPVLLVLDYLCDLFVCNLASFVSQLSYVDLYIVTFSSFGCFGCCVVLFLVTGVLLSVCICCLCALYLILYLIFFGIVSI